MNHIPSNDFTELAKVADELYGDGDLLIEVAEPAENPELYEDDGILHINAYGVHLAFNIGQDLSKKRFNRQVDRIIAHMGLSDYADAELVHV